MSRVDKCRVCGCTDLNPCLFGGGDGNPVATCAWVDFDHTLCSNIRCIAVMPLADLLEMCADEPIDPEVVHVRHDGPALSVEFIRRALR